MSAISRVKLPARVARSQLSRLSRALGLSFELQALLLHPRELEPELVVWLPLSSMTRWSKHSAWPRPLRRHFVIRGDWDERLVGDLDHYWQASRNYRSTLQIFRDGVPFRECDQYQYLLSTLLRGAHDADLEGRGRTERELDAYFEDLHRIFDAMARDGYRSQEQLGLGGRNEICVVLDRNGAPVRVQGGNHRFAMAQVLGLERVPVYVLGIHELWAREAFLAAPRRDLASAVRARLAGLGR